MSVRASLRRIAATLPGSAVLFGLAFFVLTVAIDILFEGIPLREAAGEEAPRSALAAGLWLVMWGPIRKLGVIGGDDHA